MLGGLGPSELLVIVFVIVLLFGGKKLPELAKGLGKGIREFKKAQQGDFEDPEDKKKLPSDD
jgi:sec-independent protein translocase protein TatA